MTRGRERSAIEWVGGLVSMPAYVTGEGEPYRPEALFWVGGEGAVLGMTVDKPGVVLAAAGDSLQETMLRPMWGEPHAPRRVRVAAAELAAALRQKHPALEVVCAPTPEIDAVLASMHVQGENSDAHESVPYASDLALTSAQAMLRLRQMGRSGEEFDRDMTRPLEDVLMRRFATSGEARALTDMGVCSLLMELATNYLGATIATLSAGQLREIIFEIFPRKVSLEASAAQAIIEQLRAFYSFLKREFALEQADACLRVLGRNAGARLGMALSNTGAFGMAKSLLNAGRAAGFDLDSKASIEALMRVLQSGPLTGVGQSPVGRAGARRGKSAATVKLRRGKEARRRK